MRNNSNIIMNYEWTDCPECGIKLEIVRVVF